MKYIFINYRMVDTAFEAGQLKNRIENRFEDVEVFKDTRSIHSGDNLEETVFSALDKADLVLSLVDPNWLEHKHPVHKRLCKLKDENDWVRREIEHLHENDRIDRLIPVRFRGFEIPSPEECQSLLPEALQCFASHTLYHTIRKDSPEEDLDKLLDDIKDRLGLSEKSNPVSKEALPQPDLLLDFPVLKKLRIKLPQTPPFKGLRPFKKEDARLFFGRSQEIYKLCYQILIEEDPQLILLDGYSGTGKSSLLQAGLIPRVEEQGWKVVYGRREEDEKKGLPGVFSKLMQQVDSQRKKALIIVDQLEEAITNPIQDEKGELTQFFQLLEDRILNTDHKFILGFRSEYTARMEQLLGGLDHFQFTLQPLSFAGALEAIRGVFDDDKLRKHYQLTFSDIHLPKRIVDQFYGKGDNFHLAPLLQVNMELLYNNATANHPEGEAIITPKLFEYNLIPDYSKLLDHYLNQLDYGNTPAERRQVLEILDFYVEDKPASAIKKDKRFEYNFSSYERAQLIFKDLKKLYLLTSLKKDGAKATRLAHDILAPLVRKRFIDLSSTEDAKLRSTSQRLILKDVEEHILHLEYDQAADRLMVIATELNYRIEDIVPELMEVSFFFNETAQPKKAISLLQPVSRLSAYTWLKDELNSDIVDLKPILKRIKPKEYQKIYCRYYPKMIFVEGGYSFSVYDYEQKKEYEVQLDSFKLAQYQTTYWQYVIFARLNEINLKENEPSWGIDGNNPVVKINWYDAVEFTNWLSEKLQLKPVYEIFKDRIDPNNENNRDDHKWLVRKDRTANGFRLPTGEEWEYAARGGRYKSQFKFAGSEYIGDVAWYLKNTERTKPVGLKKSNALNLYDMSGNVWEWCWDWHPESLKDPIHNLVGAGSGRFCILRGGAWDSIDGLCSVIHRDKSNSPHIKGTSYGFRLSQSI